MQTTPKTLKQILEIGQKSSFLKAKANRITINEINYLPLGQKLKTNILNEWIRLYQDASEIPSSKKNLNFHNYFSSNYFKSKEWQKCMNSFNKTATTLIENIELKSNNQCSKSEDQINIIFSSETILSHFKFFKKSQGFEQFYKTQAQRKIWWMKVIFDA